MLVLVEEGEGNAEDELFFRGGAMKGRERGREGKEDERVEKIVMRRW